MKHAETLIAGIPEDLYRCLQSLIQSKTRFSNRMENLDQDKSSYQVGQEMITSIDQKIKENERSFGKE